MVVLSNPFRSLFFIFTSNFSDHDNTWVTISIVEVNTFSFRVNHESFKDINEISSIEWISSNSDDGWLTKTSSSCLVNSLICQGTGSGNDADFTILMDIARHNSDLALIRLDNSGAVRLGKYRYLSVGTPMTRDLF